MKGVKSNERIWTPPACTSSGSGHVCVAPSRRQSEIGCSRISGLLCGARSLRATMGFAHREPVACRASRATLVIGFAPVADRPLCHGCGARRALRRCEVPPLKASLSVVLLLRPQPGSRGYRRTGGRGTRPPMRCAPACWRRRRRLCSSDLRVPASRPRPAAA